jgi:hypothetical protein
MVWIGFKFYSPRVRCDALKVKAAGDKYDCKMVKVKTDLSALSSRDEKALLKILNDPVRWGELFLHNRNGSSRQFWEHQKEDLRCRSKNIIHQDGRDVGKHVLAKAGIGLHHY